MRWDDEEGVYPFIQNTFKNFNYHRLSPKDNLVESNKFTDLYLYSVEDIYFTCFSKVSSNFFTLRKSNGAYIM